MKKFATIMILLALSAIIATSCKTHERCGAYGKVEKKETGKRS